MRVRAMPVLLLTMSVVACRQQVATTPDPVSVLQAIPPADPAHYERIQDMKNWRNPYLIVRPYGVDRLDSADSEEVRLKMDEVLPALSRLPASSWPYGRVVAVEVPGRASEQDAVAIRRNKGNVGGMLEGARVAVKWVGSN